MYHHKYSLAEWEDMMPWERDAYISLLTQTIEAENEKLRSEQQQQGKRSR